MSFTALVTDSTAGVSEDFAKAHNIRIVPLYLKMEDRIYRDGVDMSPTEFYERLPRVSVLPTTSQPSSGDFARVYRELAAEGADAIISVHLSSGISGTVSSAHAAAAEVEGVRIEVVDTQSASAAQRFAVEAGARALAKGSSVEETLAVIRAVLAGQRIVFTVDTLEYLYRGGRIGGAAALLGSLLQFKPVLYLKEGKIDALERVRTSNRALKRMVELMVEWLGVSEPLSAVVIEAAAPERTEMLSGWCREHLRIADLRVSPLTPVLGAHVGNGTVGLCCCPTRLLVLDA